MKIEVKTLEVKSLDKYQPTYKDGRKLKWIRWDIDSLTDYKVVSMPPECRWFFLCLVCLGTDTKNRIPADDSWLSHMTGINKKVIPKYINMLQTLDMVVTNCDEMSPTYIHTDIQTDKQTDIHKEVNEMLQQDTDTVFNYFCAALGKGLKPRPDRLKIIKGRLEEGYTVEQLKTAIDKFRDDPWEGRGKFIDIVYCMGKQQGKGDNLEKWLNYEQEKPKPGRADKEYEEVNKWEEPTEEERAKISDLVKETMEKL